MKKFIPHIIITLTAAAAIVLFITDRNSRKHKFDDKITLRKRDKIPYGASVAFNNLKYLFPEASVFINRHDPGYWDSLSLYGSNQLLMIITPQFYADEFEMKRIIAFVENGNSVFISTRSISSAAEELLGCQTSAITPATYLTDHGGVSDSLNISLLHPPFSNNYNYSYPGSQFSAWTYNIDTATFEVLGKDELQKIDFIHLRAGKGDLYLQLAPLAFSNYFLLYKNNISYYENVLSLIPKNIKKIVWDEYYLNKKYENMFFMQREGRSNWLNVVFRYPALKAALLVAIFTLAFFVLQEMRRKQRYIPIIAKPRNDSLDFVRTIGRLYYDKGDHKNLCRKMAAYFLEHIRSRYKLPTNKLDEEFIKNLQFKTSVEESEIRHIVSFIRSLDEINTVHEKQLTEFHKRLESFYKIA